MTVQALFTAGDVSAGPGLVQNTKLPYVAEAASGSFENIMSSKMDSKKAEVNSDRVVDKDVEASEKLQPEHEEVTTEQPEELTEETGEKTVEETVEKTIE